jgi:hypothetical protein
MQGQRRSIGWYVSRVVQVETVGRAADGGRRAEGGSVGVPAGVKPPPASLTERWLIRRAASRIGCR